MRDTSTSAARWRRGVAWSRAQAGGWDRARLVACLTRTPVLAVLAVVGFLCAQWIFLMPLVPSDQVIYFKAAAAFPDIAPEHWQLRIGLILPVRLLIELFGYSETAYYGVPIAGGALLCGSTFFLGRALFGPLVAVAGALMCAMNSFVLLESSSLLPDVLAAGLFTLGLCLVLRAAIRSRSIVEPRLRYEAPLVVAGLLLGWSYLTREFVALLFPLVGVVIWQYRLPLRQVILVGAAALAVFVGEVILNAGIHGDPLVRLSVAAGHGQGYVDPAVARTFQDQPLGVILGRLPEALLEHPDGVVSLLLLIGLFCATTVTRDRRFVLLAAWIVAFWVPLTLLGGVADPASPSLRLQKIRYWFPIFPALYVGGIAAISLGASHLRVRFGRARLQGLAVGLTVLISLTVTSTHLLRQNDVFRATGANHLGLLDAWLTTNGRAVDALWTDSRTASLLPIALAGPIAERRGSIQVLQPSSLRQLQAGVRGRTAIIYYGGDPAEGRPCGFCRVAFERALGSPPRIPRGWQLAAQSRDGYLKVYLLG